MTKPNVVLYGAGLFADEKVPIDNKQQLQQVLDSVCKTIELWTTHIWYNPSNDYDKPPQPRIYYNDTIMVDENGVFNHELSYLADFVKALRDDDRCVFFGIGAGGSDFTNVQELFKSEEGCNLLQERFKVLFSTLAIDGIDFDMEESYGEDMKETIVKLTILLGDHFGKLITYCPFCDETFWFGCLEKVYKYNEKQYVKWFNLQCYDGGWNNTSTEWAEALAAYKGVTGVPDVNKFMVPGYWVKNNSKSDAYTPDEYCAFFAKKSIRTDAAGGFIWNSEIIWKHTSNTIADYAKAVYNGLMNNCSG